MALSGTIIGTTDNENYQLTCEWNATQAIADNTSTINAKVYLQSLVEGMSTYSDNWECTINGVQVSNGEATIDTNKILLGERTWTVTHTSNGTCSIDISFSYSNSLTSVGTDTTKTGSGEQSGISLNKINRASDFTLEKKSLTMGETQTVTILSTNPSFYHTVRYTFGSTTVDVGYRTTGSTFTFTLPTSLGSEIPTSTSGTCTVTVKTYEDPDASNIGTVSKTFKLSISGDSEENIPTVTIKATYNNTLQGYPLANKSTVKITPSATAKNGATIKSYSYSGAGLSGTGSSKTTKTLPEGDYTIKVTATDSRGFKGSALLTFSVYPYSPPTCSITGYRVDKDGNPHSSGTFAYFQLTWKISNPNNVDKNAHTFKYQYKKSTSKTWLDWRSGTLDGYEGKDVQYDAGDNWTTDTTWQVRFIVYDSFGSSTSTCELSNVYSLLNLEKEGIGIGKIHEEGLMDIGGDIYARGNLYTEKELYAHDHVCIGDYNNYDTDGECWLEVRRNGDIGKFFTKVRSESFEYKPAMYLEVYDTNSAMEHELLRTIIISPDYVTPDKNNKCAIGSPWWRWSTVYASNGTISTSDGRYKYILENIDDETCFNLIKDTNLYGYSILDKRIDEYVDTTEISDELQESSKEDSNLHMGIIAQDIEDNELGKYILTKHYEKDSDEFIYGIDNYSYTTALHGALQREIKLREELQKQVDELRKEIENLKKE